MRERIAPPFVPRGRIHAASVNWSKKPKFPTSPQLMKRFPSSTAATPLRPGAKAGSPLANFADALVPNSSASLPASSKRACKPFVTVHDFGGAAASVFSHADCAATICGSSSRRRVSAVASCRSSFAISWSCASVGAVSIGGELPIFTARPFSGTLLKKAKTS